MTWIQVKKGGCRVHITLGENGSFAELAMWRRRWINLSGVDVKENGGERVEAKYGQVLSLALKGKEEMES